MSLDEDILKEEKNERSSAHKEEPIKKRGFREYLAIFSEHLAVRPAKGWVLSTKRQKEECERLGLPPRRLAAYTIFEEIGIAILVAGLYYPIVHNDANFGFPSYVASTFNYSKDLTMNIIASYKALESIDLIFRIGELTIWPRRPRASIVGGAGYLIFCRYAPKISQSKFFQKNLTKGPGKILGSIFYSMQNKYEKLLGTPQDKK